MIGNSVNPAGWDEAVKELDQVRAVTEAQNQRADKMTFKQADWGCHIATGADLEDWIYSTYHEGT